jgi:Spy/CpxP family protein refolding chaperone
MKNLIRYLVVLLILIGGVSVATAQGPFGRGKRGGANWEEHMKNFENFRLLKLLEILDLSEDQTGRFVAEFSLFRKENRNLGERLDEQVQLLAENLKTKEPDDEEILKIIDGIDRIRILREEARKEFYEKSKAILTPVQIGKLLVFENRFEREVLRTVPGMRSPGGRGNRW